MGGSWAAAALMLLHLGGVGALPKEVPVTEARAQVAAAPIRVLIIQGATSVALRPGTTSVVENADTGQALGTVSAGALLTARRTGGILALQGDGLSLRGSHLAVRPTREGASPTLSPRGGLGTRGLYSGLLEFRAHEGVDVIEHVDLETYTAGVVAAEVPQEFPLEAMKAQAIAVRTYTAFHLCDHEAEGADLCAQVHCQAYHGQPAEGSKARRAVKETAGEVLAYHGLLIDAQYHAACGGRTVAPYETRQGKLLPYLSACEDVGPAGAYCAVRHTVTWSKRLGLAEAQKLVARNLGTVLGEEGLSPGRLLSLRIEERSGERVKWLDVTTTTGTYRIMGDAIRWLFGSGVAGPSGLRSTHFDLKTTTNPKGRPTAFVFTGRGHGHGIGMCQWGARGRAAAGQTAQEILLAYYPGTTLEQVCSSDSVVGDP